MNKEVERNDKWNHFQKIGSKATCNGVVVRPSLQPRKHSLIDQRLQIIHYLLSFSIHIPHTCKRETTGEKKKHWLWKKDKYSVVGLKGGSVFTLVPLL